MLVTVDVYRQLTHDTVSASGDVEFACEDGQRLIEELLRRPLESAERSESMRVDWGIFGGTYSARAYPKATPVTVVPADMQIDGNTILFTGDGVGLGDMPGPFTPWDGADDRQKTTITYTGGYTSETLPVTLKRAIAEAAYGLTRAVSSSVPYGATNVKVGDVSVSYGPQGASGSATGSVLSAFTIRSIKKYAWREA